MEQTTKRQLEAMLERVVSRTGINYSLSVWSPGDGKTRYQLVVRDPKTGGEHNIGRVFLGKTEMYDGLRLLEDHLIFSERMKAEQKEIEAQ